MNFKFGEIIETEKFQFVRIHKMEIKVLLNVLKIVLKKKKYLMFFVFLQNLDFVLLEIHMKDLYLA